MRLFRTVSLNEFAKVAFGEAILPKEQKSPNCIYNDGKGNMVSAAQNKPSFICCFDENIFWYGYDERVVMFELEIPEDRVISRGYGKYYSMMWNPFVNDTDGGWWVSGEFGLKRHFKDGIEFSIKETYLSSYSREDIVNVYFLDNHNIPSMGIPYDENHVYFDAYEVYNAIIRKFTRLTSKRYYGKYNDSAIWCKPYNPSLTLVKKLLMKELNQFDFSGVNEVIEFIGKWKFYNDIKVLERAMLNNNLSTAFNKTLDMSNVAYTMNQYFTTDYIVLENMYDVPAQKPEKLIEYVHGFKSKYTSIGFYETQKWDWEVCEQFIYSMMKEAKLV